MQIDPVEFDYSRSSLIKPPFADLQNKENKDKFTKVVIDSRDRDVVLFPNPAQYEVELPDDIQEVTAVELVLADIPFTAYNISRKNNKINVNGTIYVVPPGDYDILSLSNSLDVLLTSENINVGYNQISNKIKFDGNGSSLTITPTANSLNKTIGLESNVTYNDLIVESTHKVNLSKNQYVVLSIDQVHLNNSITSSLHKSFAILSPNMSNICYQNSSTKIIKYLNPPIARITKIKITLRDYDGELYDFQNYDHRLELILESRKHLKKFT